MQIMFPLYIGQDVFLLVDDSQIMEMMTESLQKLIQQRYGYNSAYITCEEDILNADDGDFSETGSKYIREDIKRLAYIIENDRLQSQGNFYGKNST